MCDGFNETYDSYTGLESLSVMEVEEMPLRECVTVWVGVCSRPASSQLCASSAGCVAPGQACVQYMSVFVICVYMYVSGVCVFVVCCVMPYQR